MAGSVHGSEIQNYFLNLQDDICKQLETLEDDRSFREDQWDRPGGGGGRSRILRGDVIEKGGVNYSAVHGTLSDQAAVALESTPGPFFATGVSIVLHPKNPWVPIIHMNVRYFERGEQSWWFGGGIDLTPHYIDTEEAGRFHQSLKEICDRHDCGDYDRFKQWADEYFYLQHRKETRGVGGIFFDRLGEETDRRDKIFSFVRDVGEQFAPIYKPLVIQSRDRSYGEDEKQWQLLRRGRYVEFNLVWDRGTKFGLETEGRTESILMSLPAVAAWEYMHEPEVGSSEAKTLSMLKKGIDWIGI